jgi:hypothetical protein
MAFEIVGIENGDVFARYESRDEAVDEFVNYVSSNLPSHPTIATEVVLIELDDDHGAQLSCRTYRDITEHGHQLVS